MTWDKAQTLPGKILRVQVEPCKPGWQCLWCPEWLPGDLAASGHSWDPTVPHVESRRRHLQDSLAAEAKG